MAKNDGTKKRRHPISKPTRSDGALLAAIIRDSNDAITVQDFDGSILAWNRGAERMYGYSEEEALKVNISATFLEGHGTAEREMKDILRAGEVAASFETRRRTKDGRAIDVSLTATLLRDDDGEPSAIATTERDITALKSMERALRQSEERFRVSLINSPVMVFSQDSKLRYTWLYHPQPPFAGSDVLGKTDIDLLPPQEAGRLTAIKERVLQTGVGIRDDVHVTRKDETFYFDLTVEPVRDSSGAIVGITGASLDITRRRRTEEKLQRAREELENRVERRIVAGGSGYGLTFRELTVLHLVAEGKADKEIGAELGISPLTAHKHISNILAKMNAVSRTEAGVRAVREELL